MVVKNLRRGLAWKGSDQDNFSISINPLVKFDKETISELLINDGVSVQRKKRFEGTRTKEGKEQQKQEEQENENCN